MFTIARCFRQFIVLHVQSSNILPVFPLFFVIFRNVFAGFTTSVAIMTWMTLYFAFTLVQLEGWNILYVIGILEAFFFGFVANLLCGSAVSFTFCRISVMETRLSDILLLLKYHNRNHNRNFKLSFLATMDLVVMKKCCLLRYLYIISFTVVHGFCQH